MTILTIWKRIGETPLDALNRARTEYGLATTERACYVNRLDPMAQGVMTILIGEQLHLAPTYQLKDKVYRFQAILGIQTATYDPLGAITNTATISADALQAFRMAILVQSGKTMTQQFPPYSAYKYEGEPLWRHAQMGTLPEQMPSHEVTIHWIRELAPPVQVSLKKYKTECVSDIVSCPPSFCPSAHAEAWTTLKCPTVLYRLVFEARVSSGTYIRELVNETGRRLSIPAHAFRITRTQCLGRDGV